MQRPIVRWISIISMPPISPIRLVPSSSTRINYVAFGRCVMVKTNGAQYRVEEWWLCVKNENVNVSRVCKKKGKRERTIEKWASKLSRFITDHLPECPRLFTSGSWHNNSGTEWAQVGQSGRKKMLSSLKNISYIYFPIFPLWGRDEVREKYNLLYNFSAQFIISSIPR